MIPNREKASRHARPNREGSRFYSLFSLSGVCLSMAFFNDFFGAAALSRKRELVYTNWLLHKRVAQFKHRATTQVGVATSPRMSRGGKIATPRWRAVVKKN